MTTYTIHKVDDERGYHYYEVHAREGNRIDVVAVCDTKQEARDILLACDSHKTNCPI